MNYWIIAIASLLTLRAEAQFTDSFADGNFTQNPTWQGDTADFVVTSSEELRLDAPPQTGNSFLSTPSQAIGGAEWEFYVELDFNPSGSNFLDVHVASSSANPDSADASYFVRIGDTEDEVSLYRSDSGKTSKLIDGKDGRVDQDPVSLRVRLTRNGTGHFSLSVDSSGGTNFVSEGSVQDEVIQESQHFTLHCHYTSTRSDKFYFDAFQVGGSPYQDSIPPAVDSLHGLQPGVIRINYDEAIDPSTIDPTGFELNPFGTPDSIKKDAPSGELLLYYPPSMPNDRAYSLEVPAVSDTAGNFSDSTVHSFHYLIPDEAEPGAVVINEIMADPSPPVGLLEREYLELHAADSLILDLRDWVLRIGGDSVEFSRRILRPGDRILLAEKGDSALFGDPDGYYFSSLPILKNSEEELALYDPAKQRIDSIHYRDDWYKDPDKDGGGWSLERIDPASPCRAGMNWTASSSPSGGTPGAPNAVLDPSHDQEGPKGVEAIVISEDSILLRFSEPVFPEKDPRNGLQITNGPAIDTVLKTAEEAERILVTESPLDTGQWYELKSDPFPDCFGNRYGDALKTEFVLPYTPRPGDVLINELLFDPKPDGSKFVECFNRSSRILDMASWEFAHLRDSVTGHERVGGRRILIEGGEYLFFSEDPEAVQREYPNAVMERAVELERLPTYRRDSGSVILLDAQGKSLDSFPYHENLHHPLLQNSKGVSLERTDPKAPTEDPGNWHSAAGPEYATPGYRNSQRFKEEEREDQVLWTEPKVFSPDMDGDRDFLKVHYRFSKPGMSCSVRIHHTSGRPIRELADGELFGREGSYTWDGTREDGSRAPIGIYVVLMECVHPSGERVLEKTSCVLGTRWDGR